MSTFFVSHGGGKVTSGTLIPTPMMLPSNDADLGSVDLSYEEPNTWNPIPFDRITGWRVGEWPYSPQRFVDGKDVGKIAARLYTDEGWPIPVRISMIGGIAMRLQDRELRVERKKVEFVVTMVTQPFPWADVEEFAIHMQKEKFRLLPVQVAQSTSIWEYEQLVQASHNRSREEMGGLEASVLAHGADVPTIVDGLLDSHSGGFDPKANPVFGVVKTHHRIMLDASRHKLLYKLNIGERLPAFVHASNKGITVLTWYLKIAQGGGQSDLDGIVRIEVALEWYEKYAMHTNFIDLISRAVMAYRCRRSNYSRQNISLDPIVICEDRLSAVFGNYTRLLDKFYYLTRIN
jgi:hypothetical protein